MPFSQISTMVIWGFYNCLQEELCLGNFQGTHACPSISHVELILRNSMKRKELTREVSGLMLPQMLSLTPSCSLEHIDFFYKMVQQEGRQRQALWMGPAVCTVTFLSTSKLLLPLNSQHQSLQHGKEINTQTTLVLTWKWMDTSCILICLFFL